MYLPYDEDVISVSGKETSQFAINAIVKIRNHDKQWQFMGVYASTRKEERGLVWGTVVEVVANEDNLTLVAVGFNTICFLDEKLGESPITNSRTSELKDVIDTTGLEEIIMVGGQYT